MKMHRMNVILLLAVVFGVAAAYGVLQYLNGVRAAYVEKGNFIQVAVAVQYIPPKTRVAPQMFTMREIPGEYVNKDAAVDPGEITGKLTKTAIYPDEQILRGKLAGKNDTSEGLAFIIPEGKRAVAVAVNEVSGVAGLVRPGDSVDVLVTFDVNEKTLTSLILQDITVLAVDRNMSAAAGQGSQQEAARTVTLSVTPQQAQPLVLASEKGSIRLVMRSPADEKKVNIPSTNMNGLVR